ncbi:hypothetical protein GW17_00035479 [Ensete ventricosum]|nr:hypothetical protein GW17_00035479 [Ensete ventricosum]
MRPCKVGGVAQRSKELYKAHRGVTQEWVDEGELPRERTKNRRWRRPYDVLAEATHGEVVVRVIERGEEVTTSPEGLSFPKAIASVRKEVDSEERHNGSARVNKDQHNLANPIPELVVGELKQYGGSKFDYSTTAAESGWEPMQPK